MKWLSVSIIIAFFLAYAVPLINLFTGYYYPDLLFASRVLGLIAFINVFVQVMLGSFRKFFIKLFKPLNVFNFHNILGLITLIIGLLHFFIQVYLGIDLISLLTLNSGLEVSVSVIALLVMLITVISSDLKYLFKVNYSQKAWRLIHILNYSLFPLLYVHAYYLSITLQTVLLQYLFIGYLVLTIIGGLYKTLVKLKVLKQ
jgi:DMSO/TMAO reductase YedYZ heme-binding membrane subunit